MRDKLSKDLVLTTAGYLLLQALIFTAFALGAGFFGHYGLSFLVTATTFHGIILAMLFLFKGDFVLEKSGERLERVNAANRITLLRVSTLPTLLFLVIAARDYRIRGPLLVLVVLVFLTDFADGYVSRKGGQITRVGRMMDSASDYSLIIVLTFVFYYFHLIPLWLLVLIVGRLLLQGVFMTILALVKRRIEPRTTFMGKAAVASIMALYAAEILKLLAPWQLASVIRGLEWVVGAVVAASVLDKAMAFLADLRRPAPEPREPEAPDGAGMTELPTDKTEE